MALFRAKAVALAAIVFISVVQIGQHRQLWEVEQPQQQARAQQPRKLKSIMTRAEHGDGGLRAGAQVRNLAVGAPLATVMTLAEHDDGRLRAGAQVRKLALGALATTTGASNDVPALVCDPDGRGTVAAVGSEVRHALKVIGDLPWERGKAGIAGLSGYMYTEHALPSLKDCCATCRERRNCADVTFSGSACKLYATFLKPDSTQLSRCAAAGLANLTTPTLHGGDDRAYRTHFGQGACEATTRPTTAPLVSAAAAAARVWRSRNEVCTLLAGKSWYFSGDSLSRDMWSTLLIWLLEGQASTVDARQAVDPAVACRANEWKYLHYHGVLDCLVGNGVIAVEKNGPFGHLGGGVVTARVCGNVATDNASQNGGSLHYQLVGGLKDVQLVAPALSRTGQPGFSLRGDEGEQRPTTVWVTGPGVAEVVKPDGDLMSWLETVKATTARHPDMQTVLVGTHRRNPARAPPLLATLVAEDGAQGNRRNQHWNQLVRGFVSRSGQTSTATGGAPANASRGNRSSQSPRIGYVDTFDIIVGDLGTADGLHVGFFANLRKLQRILQHLCPDPPLEPVHAPASESEQPSAAARRALASGTVGER